MRLISYLESDADIDRFSHAGVSELILSCRELSRTGQLDISNLENLAERCRRVDIKPVLDWDILMTEETFREMVATVEKLDLSAFASVRLQDPGAVQYILSHHSKLPIQLVLESGNHNLCGIQSWVKILGKQLERLVLSIQLTHNTLSEYANTVSAPIEILGLGRVLLFYSPRKLLSHQAEIHELDLAPEFKAALASSEEGRHKGFRVVENRHGTFLFHPKNHCLADKSSELDGMGIDTMRIDLRFDGGLSFLGPISDLVSQPGEGKFRTFKDNYPVPLMKSFYRSNKTDSVFSRLKNTEFFRADDRYLGEVVEAKRNVATVIMIKHPDRTLTEGQTIEIVSSLGKKTLIQVYNMKNSRLQPVHTASRDQVVILPYIKSAAARSRIYVC